MSRAFVMAILLFPLALSSASAEGSLPQEVEACTPMELAFELAWAETAEERTAVDDADAVELAGALHEQAQWGVNTAAYVFGNAWSTWVYARPLENGWPSVRSEGSQMFGCTPLSGEYPFVAEHIDRVIEKEEIRCANSPMCWQDVLAAGMRTPDAVVWPLLPS